MDLSVQTGCLWFGNPAQETARPEAGTLYLLEDLTNDIGEPFAIDCQGLSQVVWARCPIQVFWFSCTICLAKGSECTER